MPPPNTSFATATNISSIPVVIDELVDDGTTRYTVYFKYTPATDNVIGVFGHGDYSNSNQVHTTIYKQDEVTIITQGTDKPLQFTVLSGQTYYFQCAPQITLPFGVHLKLEVNPQPNLDIPIGSIFINDDSKSFPLIVVSGVDGSTLRGFPNIPAGESGTVLNGGGILIADEKDTSTFYLYNNQLVLLLGGISIPGVTIINLGTVISSNKTDKFYAGTTVSTDGPLPHDVAKVGTISSAGVVGGTVYVFPQQGLNGIVPSPDESILYYTGQIDAPQTIRKWDLVHNVALGDFIVPGLAASYITLEMLCVTSDGSIIQLFENGSFPNDAIAKRYSNTGTLLNTYTIGDNQVPAAGYTRIAWGTDDSNFWIYQHRTDPITGAPFGVLNNIRVSDGTLLTSLTVQNYEIGLYQGDVTASNYTSVPRFGPSQSCPFFLLRAFIPGTSRPGLVVNPTGGVVVSGPDSSFGTLFTGSPSLSLGGVQWAIHRIDIKDRSEQTS